ncbi:carcinoembryonic antigen-related cell adhesion molecule 5-like [Nothoprocta perdicaria]|uniref:carcinoembryonic antigen-related cell adhesion molecule 5-like n=1 Tax=Nothoprocta perdicaria TaxID=30464 RepID=UPI000E1B8794|nr:carcinoembryonic antigen-related cell adhesion molecule 5-like [Nothoprocta perdicaria]
MLGNSQDKLCHSPAQKYPRASRAARVRAEPGYRWNTPGVLLVLSINALTEQLAFPPAAQTLSPCYSASLSPTSARLVSAVGCVVLLAAPALNASTIVFWERKAGARHEVILSYYLSKPVNTASAYRNRTRFNESDFSLRMVLRREDSGAYRFRTASQETDWLHVEVIEPLPVPEIMGNSSVRAGDDAKLVCNISEGIADSYWWRKNGVLMIASDHIQFVHNNTLHIIEVTMNDSGYYTCVVRNKVSENEASFLLHVQHDANVVLPVMMACVIVGFLIGVFLWCRRRGRFYRCVRRWKA